MIRRTILLFALFTTCGLFAVASRKAQSSTAAAKAAAPMQSPALQPACNPAKFQQMKKQLADWPDLARYRKADAALPPPAPGQPRVVFMGDSITDIWGRLKGTGKFFPGKPYVNRGISGQTTPQMLLRFRQDVIDLHPAAVLILAGTNDIAGNTGPATNRMIEDNLRSMSQLAQANGIQVILASILPAAKYPWRPGVDPVARIREVNLWLKSYCAKHHYVYLDYYDAMAQPDGAMKPGISFDGVHPKAEGFAIMAPLAEKAIAQALENKQ